MKSSSFEVNKSEGFWHFFGSKNKNKRTGKQGRKWCVEEEEDVILGICLHREWMNRFVFISSGNSKKTGDLIDFWAAHTGLSICWSCVCVFTYKEQKHRKWINKKVIRCKWTLTELLSVCTRWITKRTFSYEERHPKNLLLSFSRSSLN